MEKYGELIAGSRFYRAFCTLCNEPIRVKYSQLSKQKRHRGHICEICNPKHIGCSSPISPLDDDAYGVSTQNECYGLPVI